MALITEDGTGKADAEALCTVAYADTYLSARGMTAWDALSTTEKEQALRRATDYLGQTYRARWAGYRVSSTQALDWPRNEVSRMDYPGCIDADSVPKEVRQACSEMALRAAAGELLADTETQVLSESVGPISVTYRAGDSKHKGYPAVERLLAPLLTGRGNTSLVRA